MGADAIEEKDIEAALKPIASQSLATFEEVANTASRQLSESQSSSGAGDWASINTFNSYEAVNQRANINNEIVEGYEILAQEPAIARVRVSDESGEVTTYYFSRATPSSVSHDDRKFASYRTPLGKLAELDVGDEFELRNDRGGSILEVIEYARFHPLKKDEQWDSHRTLFEGDGYGPLTVESLRSLLTEAVQDDADAIQQWLDEDETSQIHAGRKRDIRSKMDLRDQPILDKYQGEIFRLPLASRLLILGAPGTGKTTTLIRRLGQKLDLMTLEQSDKDTIRSHSGDSHRTSWVMFTPTELLKLYVKEAFNKEGIPAPDERIRTWTEMRESLARNEFRILRSAASSSSLVMKEQAGTLRQTTHNDQINWFTDFDRWQRDVYWKEMRDAAKSLGGNTESKVASFGSRILKIVGEDGRLPRASTFIPLMDVAEGIRQLLDQMKKETDDKITRALNIQVNSNNRFLNELAELVDQLGDTPDDLDDLDQDDDEEPTTVKTGRARALTLYMRAIRTHARAIARKRSVPKSSASGKIIDWLGGRILEKEELGELGKNLAMQSSLRTFVNPVGRFIDGMPGRYRRFRRARQAENIWYQESGFAVTDMNPHEIDIMLLSMIRCSNDVMTNAGALRNAPGSAASIIERIEQVQRIQILVDEATDFSPIQLACMEGLSKPDVRSFFACGDFNQRVTSWGTRSAEEMKWACNDLETRTINITYRQSRQLHEFAIKLVKASGGETSEVVLPDFAGNEGVPPILGSDLDDTDQLAQWLADRIVEIENDVNELPTIAVLVNSEEQVSPVATALNKVLSEFNISAEACPDGKVRGRDGTVRVFNVQHIKGLEFEAVFFVGVDQLATTYPEVYEKYLYVGATRAATYLGLTCKKDLPANMTDLMPLFGTDWS